ncbi:hypothetical protein THAOC_29686 [Thalassiosira oceanica]|uniref:Uncharacterized protein n=1 Tax=Thalassiosira oceanica TaxID=159749 RepID=K0RQQ7_THAOC|nr:hypothetical protein THAOC_29686 [Thalassiosira oceanica]|eukprot:EJK51166.1 hypothetical protein THAOC_29686 [Thalassiosira oceanica]
MATTVRRPYDAPKSLGSRPMDGEPYGAIYLRRRADLIRLRSSPRSLRPPHRRAPRRLACASSAACGHTSDYSRGYSGPCISIKGAMSVERVLDFVIELLGDIAAGREGRGLSLTGSSSVSNRSKLVFGQPSLRISSTPLRCCQSLSALPDAGTAVFEVVLDWVGFHPVGIDMHERNVFFSFSRGDNMSPVDVSRCAIRWLARRVSERERERSVPSPLRGLPRPRFFGRC